MARTALIVGAGIGGLSAGIALRQAGWNIHIVERAATPRELGFGLGLAPNAVSALAELGVADTILSRACAPVHVRAEVRRMNGTVLKRVEVPLREAAGGILAIGLRPAIHGALLDAVGMEAIVAGRTATSFSESETGVTLRLADGAAIDGDVLIGADGFGSALRRILHPSEPPPRSSGVIAVRGAVHGQLHHLGDRFGIYYLDRGLESMFVRAGDTGMYWFLSLAMELVPAGMTDPRAIVDLMAPKGDPTFRAITSATDDIRSDELFDRDPLRSWGTGRVTLLGDAAHPMLQYLAQGACVALEDAVTLREALRACDNELAPAFRLYESKRIVRGARLIISAREMGRIYHAKGVERLVRNSMFAGRTPERFYDSLEWLYGWNVVTCLA